MSIIGSKEMSEATFWYKKQSAPDMMLVTPEEIETINKKVAASNCGITDLKTLEASYDAEALQTMLYKEAKEVTVPFYLEQEEALYSEDGSKLDVYSFDAAINNILNPDTKSIQDVRYAIVTKLTSFRGLPTDMMILDEEGDYNFDYLYSSSIKVNDPLVIYNASADGRFYYAKGIYVSGWVPVTDIALCADKNEWLETWDITDNESLIIYGDKVVTAKTRVMPEISERVLTMGTVLKLVNESEWPDNIAERAPYFNYVVWLPVRREDGSYSRSMALIPYSAKAGRGSLSLTYKNIAEVAMNMLGNTYGWGGMLDSTDCSGFVWDIYRCFGLKIGKNTRYQASMPIYNIDVKAMEADEKKGLLMKLPLGTLLIMNGHVVLFLGEEDGSFYVINNVSSANRPDGKGRRIRSVIINSLDITNRNGEKWIELIDHMVVPFRSCN